MTKGSGNSPRSHIRLPPSRSNPVLDDEGAQRFISGAVAPSTPAASDASPIDTAPERPPQVTTNLPRAAAKPVDAPSIEQLLAGEDDEFRGRVGVMNLRPTAREKRALEFINKHSKFSQHSFIIHALRPALAAQILEMTGSDISELFDEND